MIDYIIFTFLSILGWIFGLFPTLSFDLSSYIGTFLYWLSGFSPIAPNFFATFFLTFWIGNLLAYIAIINILILRFIKH